MSTQIAPRPRTTRQPSRRPVTGPSPSRPTPVSPFRFGRDSCLPATVRDVSEQVRDPEIYAALVAVRLSPCARGTNPVHVRTCPIDDRRTEVAVIVSTASRTYALALRLEEYRGRWMTTALELA